MRTISIIALSSLAAASSIEAAQILSFEAGPISPSVPEVAFLGGLVSGAGSVGNADGLLPPPAQTPGGLNVSTPFVLPAIPGAVVNGATGSTTFFDTTLILGGNAAAGPAATLFGVIIGQLTGPGTFDFLSTDPDGAGPLLPTLLLSGTITNGAIGGFAGGNTASFQSNTVTYTGGAIFAAMVAANYANIGDVSIAMVDVSPSLTEVRGVLQPFNANASGLFSAPLIPEPTAVATLGVAAAALLGRRRSR